MGRTKQTARKPYSPLHGAKPTNTLAQTNKAAISKPATIGAGNGAAPAAVSSSAGPRGHQSALKLNTPLQKRKAGNSGSEKDGASDDDDEESDEPSSSATPNPKKLKVGEPEHSDEDEEDLDDIDPDEDSDDEMGNEEEGDEDEMMMLETFQEIVDNQTDVGAFPLNETFSRALGISKEKMIKEATEKKLSGESFATSVAVAYVESNLLEELEEVKEQWEPMKARATGWLKEKFPTEFEQILTVGLTFVKQID